MKRILIAFTCLTLLLSLTACAEQSYETDYNFYLNPFEAPYKDGIFKLQEGLLGFFDLESLEFQPLCNAEGCTHTDFSRCNALCHSGLHTSVFVDGDNLYTLETVRDDAAVPLTPSFHTYLVLRDMSGESTEVIASLEGIGYSSAVYVKNSVAYFSAKSYDKTTPEANQLYSLDLATGELECIMAADKGVYSSISLLGTYGDKLYMTCICDGGAISLAYDFAEGTVEEYPKRVWRAYNDIMILMDGDKSIEVITPKNRVEISNPEITGHTWFSPVVVNNYMISSGSGVAYDLDTHEVKDTHQCTLLAYYNGRYIVRELDGSYLSMSPDEFFTKDTNPIA